MKTSALSAPGRAASLASLARKAYRLAFGPPLSDVEAVLLGDQVPADPCTSLNPGISFAGDFEAPDARRLRHCFETANTGSSALPDWIIAMDGMTGTRFRSFLNLLVTAAKAANYLEIGSWKGSSACAAMAGNTAKITCIENWSEFGGPRNVFLQNIKRCRPAGTDVTLIEDDYRNVDYQPLGPFNIYLFDGPHHEGDHYRAICDVFDALDDSFTLIVDDWNWKQVRRGTKRAMRDLGLTIVALIEVRTTADNSHCTLAPQSNWHNGYFMAVCRKPDGLRSADASPVR